MISLGRTVRFVLPIGAAEDVGFGRPANIVANKKIQPAVAVVIKPQARGGESPVFAKPALPGDIDECAFPGIAKQPVLPTPETNRSTNPSLL